MRRQSRQQSDNARLAIANEAARIIQEQGLTDFRAAKDKARERLGFLSAGALPSNEEIEQALAERNRIFQGDAHAERIRLMRACAATTMHSLAQFHPRLVGAVLSGNATEHSVIELQLFSDPAEVVSDALDALGLRYRPMQLSYRFRRDVVERFPGLRFEADGYEVRGSVFPVLRRRTAPLSPVDGKPMRRANVREVERLLTSSAC